jgi:hypothetical protein
MGRMKYKSRKIIAKPAFKSMVRTVIVFIAYNMKRIKNRDNWLSHVGLYYLILPNTRELCSLFLTKKNSAHFVLFPLDKLF